VRRRKNRLLTEEEVRHVARLARLGLTDEEVEVMRGQMLDVLQYIEILQQVDTSSVEPTAQILRHLNVARQDEPRPSWPVEDILSNAPGREDAFIRVPMVLEESRGDEETTAEGTDAEAEES